MNGENGKEPGRREAPRWVRRALLVGFGVIVAGGLFLAFRPQPVPVDLAVAERGSVEVAVEEDGRTRVRDRYEVSSPVSGMLRRIELEAGDTLEAGGLVARVEGPEAALADPRTVAQLRSRLESARARMAQSQAQAEAAEAGIVDAREDVRRQEVLRAEGAGSESALERARALLRAREAEARSAHFAVRAAEGEVEEMQLALSRPEPAAGESLELRAPVDGIVLRVHRESGGAVQAGEPLIDIGDPTALEVVVDLLSADAVRVETGAEAIVTRWGGEEELRARVRRVEPAGFTRVSALGIEEQRVNVILDPADGGGGWARLGDGFRVEARIILERAPDVLRVPTGALFRRDGGWAVFRAANGRIAETPVEVGRRSQAEAEIVSGLDEGDGVVVYPSDRVADGVRYEERR